MKVLIWNVSIDSRDFSGVDRQCFSELLCRRERSMSVQQYCSAYCSQAFGNKYKQFQNEQNAIRIGFLNRKQFFTYFVDIKFVKQ